MAPIARLEVRIPISPTDKFFALVRFYNFALRRLESSVYREATLNVIVGDYCDLDDVRRRNRWSEDFDIRWERVPDAVFDEFHWGGTANWRLSRPAETADVVILSDADTVLLRDLDPLLAPLARETPAVFGHMAHLPPAIPEGSVSPLADSPDFWPWLFDAFDLPWPDTTHPYSMELSGSLPRIPAYFNLGFVALNAKACERLAPHVDEVTRRVVALTGNSVMRCQIALTILAYRAGIDIVTLPAAYNAANDRSHLDHNGVAVEDIRVLHFLRTDEIDREDIQDDRIDGLLSRSLTNPANVALQRLLRAYKDSLS